MKNSFVFSVTMALLSAIGFASYFFDDRRARPETGADFSFSKDGKATVHSGIFSSPSNRAIQQRDIKIESLILELENVNSSGLSVEERINIAQDLNKVYFDSISENLQTRISAALTYALQREENLDVVRAIAFSHSRLYFDENTLPNLKDAYARKALSFDDYHGELAHVYAGAPEDTRKKIVNEISNSHNRYAVDIISDRIASDEDIQLSRQEISGFLIFLKTNEPIFIGSSDALGYFDAILYFNWLMTISRLQNKTSGISVEQLLGNKLLDPTTDPRASVAFLISAYAKNMSTSQRVALRWDEVEARARELIYHNPDSSGLQQIGQEISSGGIQ